MEWPVYDGDRIKLNTLNARKIVCKLGEIRSEIFRESRPIRTRIVKKNLAMLGHKLGNKVYANGLTDVDLQEISVKFANHEWLYDLVWYTEEDHYTMTSMPLAVECEWNPNKKQQARNVAYSGIKYDFQKLVVCNAQLRLMIFQINKSDDLKNLEEYFSKAIQDYIYLTKGARFLFLAFYPKEEKLYYKEIVKK